MPNLSNIKTKTAGSPQLCWTAAPERLRPRAATSDPGSCFRKSYSPKLLSFKENVLQCCRSAKRVCFKPLLPMLLSIVASEICFPNLPWLQNFYSVSVCEAMLRFFLSVSPLKMFHFASPQIGAKSCSPKGPNAASLHQKLRLKIATRCLLSKLIAPKLQPSKLIHQDNPQSCLFFKAAPENPDSCLWKLPWNSSKESPQRSYFQAIVPESCSGQLATAGHKSCCPQILISAAILLTYTKNVSPKLFCTAAPKCCCRSGLYTGKSLW